MAERSPKRGTPARTGGESAGRVIAGSARGTRLVGPGEGTRPLGDRVKQTLFAILEPGLRDRDFLDLYAGSGAAGIEALSRGASRAVFVESDRKAIRTIDRNLKATGLAGPRAIVAAARVARWLGTQTGETGGAGQRSAGPFVVIFVDPPYDAAAELGQACAAIAAAGRGTILARDGVLVAKHFWRQPPAGAPLLASFRQERFGETMLTFHRWADEVAADGEAS